MKGTPKHTPGQIAQCSGRMPRALHARLLAHLKLKGQTVQAWLIEKAKEELDRKR